MTPETFAALIAHPDREHDPLMLGDKMVVGFDGTYALLHGGGRVRVEGLRMRGGKLEEEKR